MLADGNSMILYRNAFSGSTRSTQYFIIHESAHGIASFITQKQYELRHRTYDSGKDRNCYNNYGVIKTYASYLYTRRLGYVPYDNQVKESWAESVSNTIQCKDSGLCPSNGGVSINNWPSNCSTIVDFVKKTLD